MPPILPTPSEDFSEQRPPQRPTAPAAVGRSATATALVLRLQRGHGNQVLNDLKGAEHDAQTASHTPPTPTRAPTPHPKPPARPIPREYGPFPPKMRPWTKPPGGKYNSVAELRSKIHTPLHKLKHAKPNSEWNHLSGLDWAKLEKWDPSKKKLWEDIQKVFKARRDPDRLERLIAKIYEESRYEGLPPQEWLIQHFGGASGMPVLMDLELNSEVFRDALLHDKPAIDFALDQTKHGAYVHMLDELLMEEVLGSKEAARDFRHAIAMAKGTALEKEVYGGETYEKKFFSQIWDALFYSTDSGAINEPESLGTLLIEHLGFLGRIN